MAQNITLMGASYSDVPAVELPKTGGGTATFTDVSPTTAVDEDVTSGKIYFKADGSQSTGTASGGGSSNVVTGTFTGTTTGAAMSITLNYTGSGYPLVIVIYPDDGPYNSSSTFYSLVQRYATNYFAAIKIIQNQAQNWTDSSNNNKASVMNRYKSSTSVATLFNTAAANDALIFRSTFSPTTVNTNVAGMSDAKTLKVYIASDSYGFAANIKYRYYVIYSS